MSLAVVVGNPKLRSRTWQAAHLVAEKLTGRQPDLSVDLIEFGAALSASGRPLRMNMPWRLQNVLGEQAVFRLRRRGRAAEAALCEVVVPRGAARTARHLGRAVARATRADYVVRLGRATPAGGYLPLPNQGPILTWRALASTAAEPPPLDDWELSLGDVELL